ncbi:MAG: TetR/AcrR family transcriptional regulator [Steroidobacteraceae bacterium]
MKRDSVVKRVVGRREQKKAETAQRIAIAGRKLLRAKGFDALTTQEVALEAGIPPGTLFGYISSKTDLLILALVHEAMEFVDTIKPRLPSRGTFVDRTMFVFNEMAEYHARDVNVSKHFLRELAVAMNPDLQELASSLGQAVRNVVIHVAEQHQADGHITKEISADQIGRLLFAHYWQYLRNMVSGVIEKHEFDPRLREAVTWQVIGLSPARQGTDVAAAAPVKRATRKPKA